jgi:hypothetical protein
MRAATRDQEPSGSEIPIPTAKTSHSGLHRITRRWRAPTPTEWISLAVFGAFGFFRFFQALRPPQGVWQDSLDYEAAAGFSLLSKTFWAGARPPLAPLLWKFTGTPTSFVIAQTAIAVLAWGFLAITVAGLIPRGWRRVLAMSAILAFACTLPVSEWDWSVLTESLSLSALALIFAFSIRFVRTTNYTGLLCSAAAFALARDEDIWTIAIIGIVILVGALVVLISERRTKFRRHRQISEATAALGVSLIVLALIVEIPAITSQRDVTNITDNLLVRIFPFPSRVGWFAEHGMPDAAQVDQLAASTPRTPGTALVVSPDLSSDEFGSLDTWIGSNGAGVYTLWLLEHPGFFLTAPFTKPPLTFNDASGNIAFYAAPNRVSTSLLDRILFPGFWGEWATLALAFAFLWWRLSLRRYRRKGRTQVGDRQVGDQRVSDRQVGDGQVGTEKGGSGPEIHEQGSAEQVGSDRQSARRDLWVFWPIGVLGAIGPVSMLLSWQGDGQEVTRHMVEGAVEMRLSILLVLLIAALGIRSEEIPAENFASITDESSATNELEQGLI